MEFIICAILFDDRNERDAMVNIGILNLETGEMLFLDRVGSFFLENRKMFSDPKYKDESIFTLNCLSPHMGDKTFEMDQFARDELFALMAFLFASRGQPIVMINDFVRDVVLADLADEIGLNIDDFDVFGPRGDHLHTKEFINRRKDKLFYTSQSWNDFEVDDLSPKAREAIKALFKRKIIDEGRTVLSEVSPSDYQ